MRAVGLGRWPGNHKYCRACFKSLYRDRAGAEIECSLLFADIRGSTTLAEAMPPGEFRRLLERFYEIAVDVLVQHDAIVDKFVGDEVIGIFVPALTDSGHAREAIDAGLDLLAATDDAAGYPIPIGVGVHTGIAYVGAVGTEEHVEFTALGDAVNTAARLASAAGPGELLVTEAALTRAGILERAKAFAFRELDLKGKTRPVAVVVQTVAANIHTSPGTRTIR
jgi:adenylate cyclase